MFAQVHYPVSLDPEELDAYLEKGWFRMGQTIFNTTFLNFQEGLYGAIWLRIGLHEYQAGKRFQKLSKLNANFRCEIKPATLNPQKEALYQKYKASVPFEPSTSLVDLLFGEDVHNIYNTHEVCLYDNDKLIGIGYFDLGKNSAEGISSFYDPDYKKYSIGKYLIYQKVEYCRALGMKYFYPGYFVPNYNLFDYKLEIGKSTLEYWKEQTQQWHPIQEFNPCCDPVKDMTENLSAIENILIKNKIEYTLFRYEFFNANLVHEFHQYELFDYPVFIYCYEFDNTRINPIIVFNIRDRRYYLLQCTSVFKVEAPLEKGENYISNILKIETVINSADSAEELVKMMQS